MKKSINNIKAAVISLAVPKLSAAALCLATGLVASLAFSGSALGHGGKDHSKGQHDGAMGHAGMGHSQMNHGGMGKGGMMQGHMGHMGQMMKGGHQGEGHHHDHGGQTAYGEPGDPAKPSRAIDIKMQEGDGSMSFSPSLINVKKGEQIRFKIENLGALDHEFVIATLAENMEHAKMMMQHPGMQHHDANAIRLKPKASGEILWRFTKAGEFDMSCLIPGHREVGMTGKIIVQ